MCTGAQVLAIGNPFGFDHTLTSGEAPNLFNSFFPLHFPNTLVGRFSLRVNKWVDAFFGYTEWVHVFFE